VRKHPADKSPVHRGAAQKTVKRKYLVRHRASLAPLTVHPELRVSGAELRHDRSNPVLRVKRVAADLDQRKQVAAPSQGPRVAKAVPEPVVPVLPRACKSSKKTVFSDEKIQRTILQFFFLLFSRAIQEYDEQFQITFFLGRRGMQ
jgi:hypothetical protein